MPSFVNENTIFAGVVTTQVVRTIVFGEFRFKPRVGEFVIFEKYGHVDAVCRSHCCERIASEYISKLISKMNRIARPLAEGEVPMQLFVGKAKRNLLIDGIIGLRVRIKVGHKIVIVQDPYNYDMPMVFKEPPGQAGQIHINDVERVLAEVKANSVGVDDIIIVNCSRCDEEFTHNGICRHGYCPACENEVCKTCTTCNAKCVSICENCNLGTCCCCTCFTCVMCNYRRPDTDRCQFCSNRHCRQCVRGTFYCSRCFVHHARTIRCTDCRNCRSCCRCNRPGNAIKVWPVTNASERKHFKNTRLVGIEWEYNISNGDRSIKAWIQKWGAGLHSDGSCGLEIVTPPIAGDHISNCLTELGQAFTNDCASIDNRCGLHVHVDARDLAWQDIRKLVKLYSKYEPFLYLLGGQWRGMAQYTKQIGPVYLQAIEETDWKAAIMGAAWQVNPLESREVNRNVRPGKKADGRYVGLNLCPWLAGRFGDGRKKDTTVEFRLHRNCTPNMTWRVIGWAQLCAQMVEYAAGATEAEIDKLPKSAARALAEIVAPQSKEFILKRLRAWHRATFRTANKNIFGREHLIKVGTEIQYARGIKFDGKYDFSTKRQADTPNPDGSTLLISFPDEL